MTDTFRAFQLLIDETERLHGRFREFFDPVRAKIDLSRMEMVVLNAVAEADTPPTVPRIGRSLGHSRQVIQRAVTALIERGFVASILNPDHKRAGLLVLTPRGQELKRKADQLAKQRAAPLLRALGFHQVQNNALALRTVREAIEERKTCPPLPRRAATSKE